MIAPEPLRPVDAAWLHMDRPENTADIVALFSFDRPLPLDRFRRLLQDRLLPHDRFRQRIVDHGQRPVWLRDRRFRIDHHLLREPMDAEDEGALRRLVGQIASDQLDLRHPPWRVHAVGGRRGAHALVVKLHHCLGDGFALVALLLSLADEHRDDASRASSRPAGALERVAGLVRAAPSLVAAAPAFLRSLLGMTLLPAAPATPALSGLRRAAWSSGWPLPAIRAAGRAAGGTVNDVLLAALAGALRRVPPEGNGARALVPVNLRPLREVGRADTLGNAFGLVFLDLPTELDAPADRLAAVRERMQILRQRPDAQVAYAILGALGLGPRGLERLGTEFFSRKASLVVTNVPGPRRALHLAGRRLDRLVFWVPHPAALGLGVSLLSYAGEVTVGVRADAAVLADPAALAAAFQEELAALAPARAPRRPAS